MRHATRPSRLLGGALVALALTLASAAAAGLPDLDSFMTPVPAPPPAALQSFLPDLGIITRAGAPPAAPRGIAVPDRVAQPALLTATVGWSSESNVANRMLGMSLTPAGDVDGDGISDFVAIGDVNSYHSALYLYLGSASGPVLASGYPVVDLPPGAQVAPAGDVNGDNLGDIVLFWYLNGSARVYFGAAGGLDLVNFNSLSSFGSNLYGFNVAPAGDVNGDGFGDLIFGMPSAAGFWPCTPSPGSGVAEVLYGSATGVSMTNNWFLTGCTATGLNAHLGSSVAGAGDVNADGFDDIIVGAPLAEATFSFDPVGKAYVIYGSAAGLPLTPGFSNLGTLVGSTTLLGHHQYGEFGATVAPAGDLNGDGYADVAVGAPADNTYGTASGMAFVFRGSAAGVDTATANLLWWESSGVANAQFGITLTPAGDVNGDGRPDLLIGESSRVDLAQSVGTTLIIQQLLGYPAGSTHVMTAGDVNGDGLSDLLVGDPYFTNGESSEGRVLVHYGVGSPPSSYSNWSITQTAIENPNLGWSVASAGDVNGDGYDDVLVGEPTWYNYISPGESNNGLIQLFRGSATGLVPTATWYTFGASGDQLGVSVASAGDINGDGYADLIIGAHTAAGGVGQARIWYGGPGGLPSAPNVTLTGFSAGSQFGGSVAPAGDVDGDGYADVIVGAPMGVDPTSPLPGEGRVYVYRGGPGGLSTTPMWSASGGQADAHLGSSVAGAGDVNGDGFSDVVIGAPDFDTPGKAGAIFPDAGHVVVAYGSTAGPSTTFTISARASSWRFGASVAGAGDVNGDGLSDIIVGAPSATNTLSGEGAARVFIGIADGSLGLLWTQYGGEAYGGFGSAVSSAGDVDGDGLSDVLVGAVFQDQGGPQDQGAAHVFRGPLPAGAPAFWSATGGSAFANMGHSLANAGDVNSDGWSDLIFGEPGYSNVLGRQGLCQVRYGAQGSGSLQLGVGYRSTAPAHLIQPGCQSDPGGLFLLSHGRSAAGRTRVRLQYRVTPVVGLPAPGASGITGWVATGAPGAYGSMASLLAGATGLTSGVPYAWQMRTLARSVYFPNGPWRSPTRSGRLETDFRVPGAWVDVASRVQPATLMLADAHPNPMLHSTSIAFTLTRPGDASLDVLDVQGRRVRLLVHGAQAAGEHRVSWDGLDQDGRPSSAGIYFLRLDAEGRTMSRKIARMR